MSRSGLWGQLGIAAEGTYGTYVAPAAFLPFDSDSFTLDRNYQESRGLRAGRMFQASALSVPTTKSVEGSFPMEVLNKGMGKLLNQLHGNTVSPVQQGATAAYLQTHDIGNTSTWGKSMSIQVGKPQTNATPTVTPFSYLGAKATGVTFGCEVGGFLTSEWSFDARDETTAQALGAATYATGLAPFTFVQGTVEIDDAAVGNIIDCEFSIELNLKTDRFFFGTAGLKSQPITNDYADATANCTVEFDSLTTYNYFVNGTTVKLELIFTGGVIEGAHNYTFQITAPACQVRGETPQVGGPDILTHSAPFRVLDNGTNPPLTITYKSTDTAL